MNAVFNGAISAMIIAGCIAATPASAQVLGGGSGLLDSVTNTLESVVSVSSGPPSSESLVNVGLGGGSGNVLGVQTGGGLDGVANVRVASNGGGLQADVDLLGIDVGVNVLGGGGSNGPVNPPRPRILVPVIDGNGNGGIGGSASAGMQFNGNCSIQQGRQLLQLAASTKADTRRWHSAANVQVIPVKLCPATRKQIAAALRGSSKIVGLQQAAATDALITASLQRTKYRADDVFAVSNAGGTLTVYVY